MITFSDCGGVGSTPKGGAQGAWLVGVCESKVRDGQRSRMSVLSWKSARIKRAVNSTLAGETLSLSACLGEAEWVSLLLYDAHHGNLDLRTWREQVSDITSGLSDDSEMQARMQGVHVVDAKAIFDTLHKLTAGSQADRRTAIELALIRQIFSRHGSEVRWIPHPKMPSDCMTKADVSKSNDALSHLLRHGTVSLVDESTEMGKRKEGSREKGRSKTASKRALLEDE
jgi:hypothetical protein